MEFIKKSFAFLAVALNTIFAYSVQPKSVASDQFAIIVDKTSLCQKSLEDKIKKILDSSTIKISNASFTKESHLFLTNQKNRPMIDNPLQGYEGGNKIFLLHLKDGACFISLVDSKNRPLSSLEIELCNCIKVDDK
ncbi:MAG TPA: hypothetical protein EYH01_07685 [Campylobacterales bacterium]|nr:hypothetical protein [Campylobacterales bacterium]HIP60289.1 hypothetical protein [Campylobacterales bacterium]